MLSAGQAIAHFQIMEQLGAGGMGVVYKARDVQLNRIVALKVLPASRAEEEHARARLLKEARAASALNHPNIVTIHEAGSADAIDYIAMEFVEGTPLDRLIPPKGMPVESALSVARAVSNALAAAHAAGIVHRDLKPANVMVRMDGAVKVMDFGLAKTVWLQTGETEQTRTVDDTAEGAVLGTGPYMSPEQAEGKPVDPRSDIFSFGSMFYEMLTGERAFRGDTLISVISAVLKDTPAPVRTVRHEVEPELERVIDRCLQKDPAARYVSGAELAAALDRVEALQTAARPGQRRLLVAATVALLAFVAAGVWWGVRQRRVRWVYREALPEVSRLFANQQYMDAYETLLRAREALPGDPFVEQVANTTSVPFRFQTDPPGARIYVRRYLDPSGPERLLGESPADLRLPRAIVRARVAKDGFEDFEGTVAPGPNPTFVLDRRGSRPDGMIRVMAGSIRVNGGALDLPSYWLDTFEVSNRAFKKFVDAGGYTNRAFWKHAFGSAGREMSFNEAMRRFVDATGRPGPATWQFGSYAENHADYPVSGVSWYEAAAYAEYAGKTLPTVAHWQHAAGFGQFSEILKLSNFGTQGPAPAGTYRGVGPYGTYDMAGNVREWCFNAVGNDRAALGGSWQEPPYRFRDFYARHPMERAADCGFRCARYIDAPPPQSLAPILEAARDPAKEIPVDDKTFESWRASYAYDPAPLDPKLESIDDTAQHYRKEKITVAAAYGGERLPIYVFVPKNASPPYKTVVYWPSGEANNMRDSRAVGTQGYIDFIMRSGRALIHPIYQGTYERNAAEVEGPNAFREQIVQRSKDLRRAVDYLQTRKDIDANALGYYGISMGCREGIFALPLEPRIKAAALAYCGIPLVRQPEGTDPVDFAPRIKIPVLLLEARDDFTYPVETAQLPLFRLLGSPEAEKKFASREGGHIGTFPPEMFKQILEWFDRYLGPVR